MVQYQKVKLLIKEKTMERKSLNAQKKSTGILDVKKHIELNNQITTLTEDIEELKSQRQMILKKLKCNDEKDVRIIENKKATLQKNRDGLQNQCEITLNEIAEEKTRYKEIIGQVSAEDILALAEEQQKIRYQKRPEILEKIKGLYNNDFSEKIFTEAEKAVDVGLTGKYEEKQKGSVLKKLQENKKKVGQRNGQQERQKNPPAKKKTRGSELF